MKKFLFVPALFLLGLIYTPNVKAVSNIFYCSYESSPLVKWDGHCYESSSCSEGYEPKKGFCEQFNNNKDACDSVTSYPCVKTQISIDPTESCDSGKVSTAIGCIPVSNTNDFVAFILRWALGVGGGIAFLLIIYAGFMIMSSSGNPDRLKAGQELLTSAIAGIIMLIFSVFILKVIGIDILGLSNLGFGK